MTRPDSFYQESQGMWNTLFKEQVGLDESQLDAIMQLRPSLLKRRTQVELLRSLAESCAAQLQQQAEDGQGALPQLASILTEEQMGRLLAWVSQNKLCVQLLDAGNV